MIDVHAGIANYNALVREVVADYAYADVASFDDAIASEEELQQATHYERTVYLRLANQMADIVRHLPARAIERYEAADRPAQPHAPSLTEVRSG